MAHHFQPSFDDLSTPLIDVTFCTLDLETTGGSADGCEITEIGAIKHRGGEVLGSFQTLVDPGMAIPPSITLLTGITQVMVGDAPRIGAVLPTFLEFLGSAVIVGHNVRFDLSFLNAAATRLGYGPLPNQSVDTVALARRLVRGDVRNLKLQTLAAHFRSPVAPSHRALDDARATAHVFHRLLEQAGSLGVTNLDDLLALPKARGSAYFSKIGLTDSLPRQPGVYVLRDRDGEPIYVGKAKDLRSRVRSYFYGDPRRSIANLMRELHSVDHRVCETVLEAEVTELRLIHAHRPRYNRKSRPPKASHYVKVTDERFPRLSVVRTLREDGLAYLGPFRSKRAADHVVTALWDALPVRRCRSRPGTRTGQCAPAQMGLAMCPCDGTLAASDYAEVVDRLLEGITSRPGMLLHPLRARMGELADRRRYEEAGWARDRHEALARALERRALWRALTGAGLMRLEDPTGRLVTVDHGRLVDSLPGGREAGPRPIRAGPCEPPVTEEVPPDVLVAEEALLIWRWLGSDGLRLVECTGRLALPVDRPVSLLNAKAA